MHVKRTCATSRSGCLRLNWWCINQRRQQCSGTTSVLSDNALATGVSTEQLQLHHLLQHVARTCLQNGLSVTFQITRHLAKLHFGTHVRL
jgi:hypothetical protein